MKQIAKRSPLFADFMLFLAVLGWAVSFPIAKIVMNEWGNYKFFFLAGRFWIAFLIFATLSIKEFNWRKIIDHAKPGFWIGITLVITFGFQLTATKHGSSGEVAFITTLNSVLVPVGLWIIFKKKVRAVVWLGLIVATAGAMLVGYKEPISISSAGWLAFVSAVGLATDIILVSYYRNQKLSDGTDRYQEIPLLVVEFFVLAILTTFLSLLTEVPNYGVPQWNNKVILGMIFMSVVATAGAFFIQTKYQKITAPERTALIFLLESPLAALFGCFLLAEAFTATMLIGATLIIVGVAFTEVLATSNSASPQKLSSEKVSNYE